MCFAKLKGLEFTQFQVITAMFIVHGQILQISYTAHSSWNLVFLRKR
jgi:hypothetical protein